MLNPAAATGKAEAADDESIFLESYLHSVNFLMRESKRRQPLDLQIYGPRRPHGWRKLGQEDIGRQPRPTKKSAAAETSRARRSTSAH